MKKIITVLVALLIASVAVPNLALAGPPRAPLKKNPTTAQTIRNVVNALRNTHAGATDAGVYYANFGKWEGTIGYYVVGREADKIVQHCSKPLRPLPSPRINCHDKHIKQWFRYTESHRIFVDRRGTVQSITTGPPEYIGGFASRDDAIPEGELNLGPIGGGDFTIH